MTVPIRAALGTMLAPPEEAQHDAMRDWRMNTALRYSLGAAVTMTVLVYGIAYRLAELKAVWPLFYVASGALAIIVIVVTTFAFVLGRTGLKIKLSRDGLEAQDSNGGGAS